MRSDVSFDRLLAEWLDTEGPQDVPVRVVDAALADARRVGQTRLWPWFGLFPTLRSPTVGGVPRMAWVLLVMALLLALVGALLVVGQPNRRLGIPGLLVYSDGGRLTLAKADLSDPRPVNGARAYAREPRWSPDGRRLAFFTASAADQPLDLVVLDDPTAAPRIVARALREPFEPSWSPDSHRLVVEELEPSAPGSGFLYNPRVLLVIDATTGATTRLRTAGLNPLSPRWSPGGDLIAFWGEGYDSETGLYVIRPDGTGMRRMAAVPCGAWFCFGWFDWSPDGASIAYPKASGETFDVWTIDVDGTLARNLSVESSGNAAIPPSAVNPTWSPDGSSVAWFETTSVPPFEPNTPIIGRIVVASVEGTTRAIVSAGNAIPWAVPRWSPDARSVIVPVYDPATHRSDRLGVFPIDGGAPRFVALSGWLESDASWQRSPSQAWGP